MKIIKATGYANSIDNGSATIEALGSGWIKTHHLLNQDLHLRLGHKYTKNHFVTYSPLIVVRLIIVMKEKKVRVI